MFFRLFICYPLVHHTFVSLLYAVTKLFSDTFIVIFCLVPSFSLLVRTNKSSLLPSNPKLLPLRDHSLLFKTGEIYCSCDSLYCSYCLESRCMRCSGYSTWTNVIVGGLFYTENAVFQGPRTPECYANNSIHGEIVIMPILNS